MKPIIYWDRTAGKERTEKVYGARALELLYGEDALSKLLGAPLLHLASRFSLFSKAYGWWQRRRFTRKKIPPFLQAYGLDPKEFEKKVEEFSSFDDFFTRKLLPEARPIAAADAVIPADGRYLFYTDISQADGFVVKGKKFSLESFLQDAELAKKYAKGSMVIARLCPSDYHRFHFSCRGTPGKTQEIAGSLYSVNPLALKKNIDIFTENKRTLCLMQTDLFGELLLLEVGATFVGSISQTYSPGRQVEKGGEKGYFSFGGSTLVLLFEPGAIRFDADLLAHSKNHREVYCQMGQSMGTRQS